jgi:hypothetical protein
LGRRFVLDNTECSLRQWNVGQEHDINKLPSISHILRNQITLWVFDPKLKAKVRGMIVLTTVRLRRVVAEFETDFGSKTYIADIKITDPSS